MYYSLYHSLGSEKPLDCDREQSVCSPQILGLSKNDDANQGKDEEGWKLAGRGFTMHSPSIFIALPL